MKLSNLPWFEIYFISMILLTAVGMIFVWVIFPFMAERDLLEFCNDKGYDKATYSPTILSDSYCSDQRGNIIEKVEVEFCDNEYGWCFVKK